jgi:cysteine synthase
VPTFHQKLVAASLRGYRDQAVTPEQMRAVKVPTLGVVGALDHTFKQMSELKALRPDMKLVILEGVSTWGGRGCNRPPAR